MTTKDQGTTEFPKEDKCEQNLDKIYPICRAIVGRRTWRRLTKAAGRSPDPAAFPDIVKSQLAKACLPDFLPELSLFEWTRHKVSNGRVDFPENVDKIEINPTLEVLRHSWKLSMLAPEKLNPPDKGEEWALVWRDPKSGETRVKAAVDEELLAIKMCVDEIAPEEAAARAGVNVGAVDAAIRRAGKAGLLLLPRSKIRRSTAAFPPSLDIPDEFITANTFTLQWHLTHACDLNCRHCYDRSKRSALTFEQAIKILDDMRAFCRDRHVAGHVSLSGGNPVLYPHFFDVYCAVTERGFTIAVLGNPVSRESVEQMVEIQPPRYYQVSLEGLQEHNDSIRGAGNFDRVVNFLGVLREINVSSAVMLTLTKANIGQVLPLAEELRNMTDYFTFNRLAQVGEGVGLELPSHRDYVAFLNAYVDAAKDNPIIGFKDNLINIVLHRRGQKLFDGCCGFGCGAAFNFLAVLPDGETHACRKFPSPLGNILNQGVAEVYDSEEAEWYRNGPSPCKGCSIRHVCGGCLASTYSFGLDVFKERDPFCFVSPY